MTERHPLKPFLPKGAKNLMLGSFPPPMKRWKMPFYYPNFQNDMWRIMGIVFFNDPLHFIDAEKKCFKQDEIIDFLTVKGIAIYDSAVEIERGNNDASDANLQVIGKFVETVFSNRTIRLYRMPSTSRAFPLKIEVKAQAYEVVREMLLY